jgi:MATE family multidrug resistance protein
LIINMPLASPDTSKDRTSDRFRGSAPVNAPAYREDFSCGVEDVEMDIECFDAPEMEVIHAIEHSLSPFVEQPDGKALGSPSDGDDGGSLDLRPDSSTLDRCKMICGMAGPVMISFFLSLGSNFVILFFAGKISTAQDDESVFAGVSMANMFANVSCFSILSGMTGAVETLASQNNGAKNYRAVGLVLQRSIVVLSFLLLPIVVIWLNTESIFLAIGTDADICNVMGTYMRIRLFSIPADIVFKSYEKYLVCQGVTRPSMLSQIAMIGVIASLATLFVVVLRLDYHSLAWAQVITGCVGLAMMVGTSWNHPAVRRTMQPPSWEALSDIKEFFSLGVPGLVMLCAEWWAFELLTVLASWLGAEAVAAETIIMQIASLAFMIPLGLGIAATTVVGNALGAGEVELARSLSKLVVYILLGCELIVSPAILLFGTHFVSLFSSDELVLSIARSSVPVLAVFTIVDGLSAVLGGVTKGAGLQHLGAYCNIGGFYIFGLPLAYYMCFHTKLGVVGLIVGIAFGPLLTSSMMSFLIFCREGVFTRPVYDRVDAAASLDAGTGLDISSNGRETEEAPDVDAEEAIEMSKVVASFSRQGMVRGRIDDTSPLEFEYSSGGSGSGSEDFEGHQLSPRGGRAGVAPAGVNLEMLKAEAGRAAAPPAK